MAAVEKYLKPEVIRQISRLDLRAQFIVKGFMQGLHASPFHGFSVEFSEHRKYTQGDNPQDIDWLVYAKTDKYYVKKFEAETNITGYLAMDLSGSMAYRYQKELSKFEYATCIAAALCYLMVHQQDPVGLVTFGEKIIDVLPPKSKRQQIGNVLSHLARLKPRAKTDIATSLIQLAAMLRHSSLVMIFSDLLVDPEPVMAALRRLKHGGNDVILFHILDPAEIDFSFEDASSFEDLESGEQLPVVPDALREQYRAMIREHIAALTTKSAAQRVDYNLLNTAAPLDYALFNYMAIRDRLSRTR